jgi:hypothetical protein
MNERIKQLLNEATSGLEPDLSLQRTVTLNEMQKFAELIVRECAEQIVSKGTDWVDFAPSQTGVRPEYWDMAQQIKQHFGVEE